MSDWQINEQQLHRLNYYLQKSDEVLAYNCIARTAQESKLFPVMPYLMTIFFDAYYRYPDLLRKTAEVMAPEDVGHRLRQVSTSMSKLTTWATLNYYLNGRSLMVNLGLVRPQDNLEDLAFMIEWYERCALTSQREHAHFYAYEAGDINPVLPERTLQVLESDAYAITADTDLRGAVKKFVAVLTQYNFLAHAESRTGLENGGPYRLGDGLIMLTRDFYNLAESDLSWMDGIGEDIPYNNLTLTTILRDTTAEVTDWGSVFTSPEQTDDRILGVGLYTSDWLTDRYQPVGMDSPSDLLDVLRTLTDKVQRATEELYRRFAGMSWRQMVEAGFYTYFMSPTDVAHMAGVFDQSEWQFVDDRTERLMGLFNEEYAMDAYVDKFAALSSWQSAQNEYYVHPVIRGTGRGTYLVPEAVLLDHDYSLRVNSKGLHDCHGGSSLPAKTGRYTTTKGRLTEEECNRAAREFDSPLTRDPWVRFDDNWVKYAWQDGDVDAMYRYTQEHARLIESRGAGLRRDDLDDIRREAGEPTWRELAEQERVVDE